MARKNWRREVEKDYDLEDGELDGMEQEEAEQTLGVEPGTLDVYVLDNN